MKVLLFAAAALLLPCTLFASQPRPDSPRWSLELKGGAFSPSVSGWSRHYGDSNLPEWGGSLAFKPARMIEIGIGGSYLRAKGTGVLPQHLQEGAQSLGGKVTFEEAPVDLFLLVRALFKEEQLLVPYAGGGYSRIFYRTKVEGGEKTSGSVNGYHVRGGLQLLLDPLDADAAQSLYEEGGIRHSYFFVEGKKMWGDAETASGGTVDIGGTSWLGGLLFEF